MIQIIDKNIILNLYVHTQSKKNKIYGIYNNKIKIYISASPKNNKANEYLIKFLAKKFKVVKKNIFIEKGKNSKNKIISIKYPKIIPIEVKKILKYIKK